MFNARIESFIGYAFLRKSTFNYHRFTLIIISIALKAVAHFSIVNNQVKTDCKGDPLCFLTQLLLYTINRR